jgi:amidase
MQIRLQPTWQEKVEAKRAKTRSKIPEEWTLNKEGLAAAKKQRQFSGPFIESFLDGHELEITSKDNVPLLAKIRSDHYTLFR